jgi:CTP:molybdopterin cytidylyltransferase MocA
MGAPTSSPVALLLAAGASTRLPPDKLALDLGGRSMVERALASLTGSPRVGDVVVVLPPGGKARAAHLASVRVHLVENPDPGPGMIRSIRVGLSSGWAKERPFLLLPADVPYVPSSVVTQVVVALLTRDAQVVVPCYRGMGGHPGAFAAALADDFFRHGDREGAREVLLRHREKTLRLNVPEPDICFDVDTPEDLAAALDPGARWARVEAMLESRAAARGGARGTPPTP